MIVRTALLAGALLAGAARAEPPVRERHAAGGRRQADAHHRGEGRFDWSSVDALLRDARANDLKLALLWFGAWKNSMSTYVPGWVKRDSTRFPRAQTPDGQGVEILSASAPETLHADQRAFAALMAHPKRVDDRQNTVVMMQVENEIGMLPVARDHGPLAEAAFRQPVPAELTCCLTQHRATLVPEMQAMWVERGAKTEGSWNDLFGGGDAAAEAFTAWHYARFADRLTAAGKAEYAPPMYVSVALDRPGRLPNGDQTHRAGISGWRRANGAFRR